MGLVEEVVLDGSWFVFGQKGKRFGYCLDLRVIFLYRMLKGFGAIKKFRWKICKASVLKGL